MRPTIALISLLLLFAPVATGCKKEDEPEPAQVTPGPPQNVVQNPPPPGDGQPRVDPTPKGKKTLPGRTIERPMRLNELRQIATFYKTYELERNRPPAKVEDFVSYIQRDMPVVADAIKQGHYQLVVNIRPNAGTIVAYELQPDRMGQHYVAKGDASVAPMTTPELTAALKSQGSLR